MEIFGFLSLFFSFPRFFSPGAFAYDTGLLSWVGIRLLGYAWWCGVERGMMLERMCDGIQRGRGCGAEFH